MQECGPYYCIFVVVINGDNYGRFRFYATETLEGPLRLMLSLELPVKTVFKPAAVFFTSTLNSTLFKIRKH